MNMRDVFVQASLEIGYSRTTTERNLRKLQPTFPAIRNLALYDIPAEYERRFIDAIKELIRCYNRDPALAQELLAADIARQVRLN